MTCEHARALFSDLADGRLDARQRAACEGHLAECAECRGEWQGFQRMLGLLHTLPRLRAPAGFAERVLAAAEPTPWPRRVLRRLFMPLPVKLPLEAAALVLIVGAVYLVQRTPEMDRALYGQAPAPVPDETPARSEQPVAPPAATGEGRAARAPARPATSPPPPPPPSAARDDAAARQQDRMTETKVYAPAEGTPAPPAADAPVAAPAPGMFGQLGRRGFERSREAPAPLQKSSVAAARMLPTVSGRLAVADLTVAERQLAELIGKVGASELGRRRDGDATVVELELAESAWPDFSRALATLGTWTPEGAATTSGSDRLRVVVRLTP